MPCRARGCRLSRSRAGLKVMVRKIGARSALQNARALCTMKPDFALSECKPAVNAPQGFGKRKSQIGNPRPKKSKVIMAEDQRTGATSMATGSSVEEEESGCNMLDEDDGTSVDSLITEEKELWQSAKKTTADARKQVQELTVLVRKAEAALRHEKRLEEEREKRWWAAERRADKPPAYLQLERVYKSKVKDLKARLALSNALRRVSDAEVHLHKCLNLEEGLKHTRELRKLCGY